MDQRELVKRAGRGDHDAFGALVDASFPRLEAAARLIVRDHELARDAVQDAYLRAWCDLPRLRDPDRFDAWLHRVTVNACLDVMRRRKRRPVEVELSPIMPPTVEDRSRHVEDRDQLERGFRRLGADQRVVLVLHYYLGMPAAAIADVLEIPVGTAQSRLHRALTELRAALAADARRQPEAAAVVA